MEQFLQEATPYLISILGALASFTLVYFKTRTNVLLKKLQTSNSSSSTTSSDYVVVDNKIYNVNELQHLSSDEVISLVVKNNNNNNKEV